jgi:hypothetical protein
VTGLVNTQEHRAARNAASIALADDGPGNASVRLYSEQGGVLLAVRTLAKPCGLVRPADGRIALEALADSPEVAIATGSATWGEWWTASDVAISAGYVTDVDGNFTDGDSLVVHPDGVGAFTLGGGEPGTMVYAGGLVLLGVALIG